MKTLVTVSVHGNSTIMMKDGQWLTQHVRSVEAANALAKAYNAYSPLLECVKTLKENLEEAHQDELQTNHFGDGPDGCSYCEAIKQANDLLSQL